MDHADEIITYTYLGGANLSITRETNCLGAQPFLGGALADGSITTRVMNDINTNGSFDAGDIPVFRYFNGSGAEILPASLPTHSVHGCALAGSRPNFVASGVQSKPARPELVTDQHTIRADS